MSITDPPRPQVSYGDMVACDNEDCPYEWFHYPCVGVTAPPKVELAPRDNCSVKEFPLKRLVVRLCAGQVVLPALPGQHEEEGHSQEVGGGLLAPTGCRLRASGS